MNIFFQLWDTTTGNLVTEFDSGDEAIEALYRVQAEDGEEALLEFALVRFSGRSPDADHEGTRPHSLRRPRAGSVGISVISKQKSAARLLDQDPAQDQSPLLATTRSITISSSSATDITSR